MNERIIYAMYLDEAAKRLLVVDDFKETDVLFFNTSPEHIIFCNFDYERYADNKQGNMIQYYNYSSLTVTLVDQHDLIHIAWERL